MEEIVRKEQFKIAENQQRGFGYLFRRVVWRLIAPLPDRLYLKIKYYIMKGSWPDFDNPQMFGEKVQVRKLEDRNPLYATLVDKHAVKAWVAERVGEGHVLPVHFVGDDVADADWPSIPLPVVVKPNHASGLGRFIYTKEHVEELLADNPSRAWLAVDHSRYNREWAYSQVKPQILVEEMMIVDGGIPWDFRLFTFNGRVSHIMVDIRQDNQGYSCAYTADWEKLPFYDPDYFPFFPGDLPRPRQLDTMIEIAAKLGAELDFARIDLFVSDEHVHVGEITLYPGGGFERFEPPEWERVIGERWQQRVWGGARG